MAHKKKTPYFDVETRRVNIHPSSVTRPTNPLVNSQYDPVNTEAASNSENSSSLDSAAREAQQDKALLRKLIRTDQRDFLSGSKSYHVKAAHLFDPMRTPPAGILEKDKNLVKEYMEKLLTKLGFNGCHPFKLDGRCNLLLLGVRFRYALDVYGDFAFVPRLKYLHELLQMLATANADWDIRCFRSQFRNRADANGVHRNLDMSSYPFDISQVAWDVLVFDPRAFPSPEGLRVMRPEKRTVREKGDHQPPAAESSNDWLTCQVHLFDGVNYITDSQATPPSRLELTFKSIRDPEDQLSLFAMLVVAAAKFEAFVDPNSFSDLPDHFRDLHAVLQVIVKCIFHSPLAVTSDPDYIQLKTLFTAAAVAQQERAVSGGKKQTPSPLPSTPSSGTVPTYAMEEDTPPTDTAFPGTSSASSGSGTLLPAAPPEPEFVNGLTGSEFVQVLENAQNPHLPPHERAESGMRLLFGAHANRPAIPTNPLHGGSFDSDSDEEIESDEEEEEESDEESDEAPEW